MSSISTSTPTAWLRYLPALACMTAIYLLSDQPKLPEILSLSGQLTSILGHFVAYGVLAALLWWALGVHDLGPRQRFGIAFVVAVLYGLTDEWHQSFVPGRTPDILDVLTDALGALAGLIAVTRLTRTVRWLRA